MEEGLRTASVCIVDLILCEVLQGIRDDRRLSLIQESMTRLTVFATGGEDLALRSMGNYRQLRKRGITIRSTLDCLIATFCIREGYSLLHSDRDFDPFEEHFGLKVVHPLRSPLQ